MNKFDMTLRQIKFDKPLREYYSPHETKGMLECIKLYNEKKLGDYQPEDLRKMISQEVCLDEMVPKGLDVLREYEMVKTNHYCGDLLSALVRVDKSYWINCQDERTEIHKMLNLLKERIETYIEIFG